MKITHRKITAGTITQFPSKKTNNEEIYNKYPVFPNNDDMYACTDVEGATIEELQEAMNKRLAQNEKMGNELDDLQEKAKKKFGFFNKKKTNAVSEVTKVDETADSISYVVASDEEKPWYVVDVDIPNDTAEVKRAEHRRIRRELDDEADAYDLEHGEGIYSDVKCTDIECKTLVKYKGYRLMPDESFGGWNVFDKNSDLVKRDLFTEQEAKEYVDSIISSTRISCATDINAIDTEVLKHEIEEACIEYLTGPEGGFKRPGEPREDRWDMFADEVFNVDVVREADNIRVEVRSELDYDGMFNMAEYCDAVIQRYDPEAYFEQVDGGIMDAYLYDRSAYDEINSSEDISGATLDDINEDVIRRHSDDINPPEYEEEEAEQAKSVFMFDITVTVSDNGDWSITEGDPLYHADILDENGIGEDQMNEDFIDLIEWNVPAQPGKYILKGKAKLIYEKDPIDSRFSFVPSLSAITDLETIGDGKIESSTDVSATEDIKAAMTEEDLDYAIENGKGFDLESFKKYKNPDDPDAIVAAEVQVGDIIQIDSAEEVNWGTIVKVLSINDPDLTVNWSDFVFHCEIIDDPDQTTALTVGDVVDLHFLADEAVGYLLQSGI